MFSALTRHLRELAGHDDEVRITHAFAALHRDGILAPAYLREATSVGAGVPPLFSLLVALGRGDLSVARLFEGHANAVQLLARLGTGHQRDTGFRISEAGGLMGVWGADDPGHPARLDEGLRLTGRKVYASGADKVALAIVAAKDADGRTQLLLLDRERLHTRFDATWWQASGMTATRSFALDLHGLEVRAEDVLGPPGIYEAQPFFGAGAIRFVSAQLGGALAIWDAMLAHLRELGRHENAHQAVRVAQVLADLESVFCRVREAYARAALSIAWEARPADPKDALIADAARIALEDAVERILPLAIRSVGCSGLMETHPLHRAVRDLMVYMRQPAPDAARVRLGNGAGRGEYGAVFDGD